MNHRMKVTAQSVVRDSRYKESYNVKLTGETSKGFPFSIDAFYYPNTLTKIEGTGAEYLRGRELSILNSMMPAIIEDHERDN